MNKINLLRQIILRLRRNYIFSLLTLILSLLPANIAYAQLNENCTVNILNRSTRVNQSGNWIIGDIPSDTGFVRARATCIENNIIMVGVSSIFEVPPGGSVEIEDIVLNTINLFPESITITGPASPLAVGDTSQLTITANFADSTTSDVTASTAGTSYTTSNPNIATVSSEGLVTATGSGQAIISARNDGTLSTIIINVGGGADSDGDGMPDDFEIANGLNPNDPNDAILDPDSDGLTNLQEFNTGTLPQIADTDGDGLNDGDEVTQTTNPLVADSDGDGLLDGNEVSIGSNPLDSDTDNDGLNDGIEVNLLGLDPTLADTDGDGTDDGLEDSDGDQLGNIEEISLHGTDPTNPDTDGDGFNDGFEVFNNTDPLDPLDPIDTTGYVNEVITDGAIAYWKMDEPSGTTANDFVGGNNGTYVNGVRLNQPPAILNSSASSVRLDGANDFVIIDSIDGLFVNGNNFTFEGWFNTTNADGGALDNIIFSANTGGTGELNLIGISGSNGGIRVFPSNVTRGSGYDDGRWHHLVVTENGISDRIRIYVDGVKIGDLIGTNTNWNLASRYSLGQEYVSTTGASRFFSGFLDEVALYRLELTEQQVLDHYNLGMAELDDDEDGLTTNQELGLGTDPNNADTDGDGIFDGNEVDNGTDPTVANTGVTYIESILGSNAFSHWTLDEDTGTTALDSIGTNDGLYINGVLLDQSPAPPLSSISSVRLNNSTDYISINPVVGDLRTGDSFTFETWFNTTDTTGTRFDNIIFSANTSGTGEFSMIGIDGSNGGIGIFPSNVTVGSGFNDGLWHHLVVTENGATSRIRVYVDGLNIGDFTGVKTNWNGAARYSIGQEFVTATSTSRHFNGFLDEISLYRRELTPQQIQTHYDIGVGPGP